MRNEPGKQRAPEDGASASAEAMPSEPICATAGINSTHKIRYLSAGASVSCANAQKQA